jgi:hypothetical protein
MEAPHTDSARKMSQVTFLVLLRFNAKYKTHFIMVYNHDKISFTKQLGVHPFIQSIKDKLKNHDKFIQTHKEQNSKAHEESSELVSSEAHLHIVKQS